MRRPARFVGVNKKETKPRQFAIDTCWYRSLKEEGYSAFFLRRSTISPNNFRPILW